MNKIPLECRDVTDAVIGAAIEVHRNLGPGLLESCYAACLAYKLSIRKIPFKKEVELAIPYKEIKLECGYRLDFVVADSVLLELKSVEELTAVHEAQLLTYMKLSALKVGILLNFNVALLRDGLVRRVL
jgi:GxxExxY protein